jgi:hypothetical protein
MSKAGKRLLAAADGMRAIARGEVAPARDRARKLRLRLDRPGPASSER